MINIKLSQYTMFHIAHLSEEQVKEIEAAAEAATQFVQAGTKKYPLVKFYLENDAMADPERAFGDKYDGKGIEMTYGVMPKYDRDRFPIIHPTAAAISTDLWEEEVIPELEVMTIADFNKYANKLFKFERMDYKHPWVSASHMIKFYNLGQLSANFPLDLWEEAHPLHYLFNELNSNRKWTDEEGYTHDVVRFWDEKYHKEIFYADIYEHTPDGAISGHHRNFLFVKVPKKDVFFKD